MEKCTTMTSAVVSWQELAASFPSTDQTERIKRGIADWYSRYRTKYVLLMGDSDVLPVRYITMDWNCHTPEPTTPTPTIIPPVYIVIIGGGIVAAAGIVILIRRFRFRA